MLIDTVAAREELDKASNLSLLAEEAEAAAAKLGRVE
jgi:hypothetical protein